MLKNLIVKHMEFFEECPKLVFIVGIVGGIILENDVDKFQHITYTVFDIPTGTVLWKV